MRFKKNSATFVMLWTVSAFLGWRPLSHTLDLSIHNDECTYILLILLVSAFLGFLEWRSSRPSTCWDLRVGPVLLATDLVLAVCLLLNRAQLSSDVLLSGEMFVLVLSWVSVFALCFGGVAVRSMLFPLMFLFGIVPLPSVVLKSVTFLLQIGSAWSTHAFFALFGVPVVQHGVFLTIPGLTVQVAQECSSIRSSSMLLVTTIVLAEVLLRSPLSKALVIALVIPLSVAKNGLRIFTIAMLGTKVDPGYLTGRLHHQGGILFFVIALLGILAVLTICQRVEGTPLKTS